MHSVVVGGTRGLGREVVRIFSDQGHTVSVLGRRPPSDADRGLSRTHYWTADITDEGELLQAIAELRDKNGTLDHLVLLQRFKADGDQWAGEIATSLTATKTIIERLAGEFTAGQDGSIVLVSSVIGRFVADGQPVGYHVAKAALSQMARYYAVALGPLGIRVNCVTPSTLVKDENREYYSKNDGLQDVFRQTIPLGRMGTAVESANVVAFFCSAKASFVTGQEVIVDGGVSLLSQEALARKLRGV